METFIFSMSIDPPRRRFLYHLQFRPILNEFTPLQDKGAWNTEQPHKEPGGEIGTLSPPGARSSTIDPETGAEHHNEWGECGREGAWGLNTIRVDLSLGGLVPISNRNTFISVPEIAHIHGKPINCPSRTILTALTIGLKASASFISYKSRITAILLF